MHPHGAEREAPVVERRLQQRAEVQRRLAELPGGNRSRRRVEARQAIDDGTGIDGSLSVARRNARHLVETARPGTARGGVGRSGDPPLKDDVHALPVRREDDEEITRAPARDLRPTVVPQSRVLIELERQEGRAVRLLAREREVQERARAGLIDHRPGVEDVVLARLDPTVPRGQVPRSRVVVLGTTGEGGVGRIWVCAMHDATRRLQSLPVRQIRRLIVLVAVPALEVAARQGRCRSGQGRASGGARCQPRRAPRRTRPRT